MKLAEPAREKVPNFETPVLREWDILAPVTNDACGALTEQFSRDDDIREPNQCSK